MEKYIAWQISSAQAIDTQEQPLNGVLKKQLSFLHNQFHGTGLLMLSGGI